MTFNLKALIGAACLTLLLAPGMILAAENTAEGGTVNPCDNGQYADEADPCAGSAMDYSDEGSGDEAAYQDEGQPMDESENDGEAAKKGPAAQ